MKGVFARKRWLCIGTVIVFLICGTVCVRAMENTTVDTLPPHHYETEEFFSWLRSETDLKALLETDRKIDGASAEGYALRLKELYDQDGRLFISTLAECSADAQYRAVHSLPYGHIGLQELQPFYDELLLFMAEDTWNEQEMEVMRQLKSYAEQMLDMMLPDPTTEPPTTEPVTENTAPEETAADPTEEMTLPSEMPDDEPNDAVLWGVAAAVLVAAVTFGVYAVIRTRKQ